MKKLNFVMPQVVGKNDVEWECLLPAGRTIKMILDPMEEEDDDDGSYISETIEIRFYEDEEDLGDNQHYFEFTRNGYVTGIPGQNYLLRNIYLPAQLIGTGMSQLAIAFFKEYTGGAGIYTRDPSRPKFDDGSELFEQGRRFVRRMQAIGLIEPHD